VLTQTADRTHSAFIRVRLAKNEYRGQTRLSDGKVGPSVVNRLALFANVAAIAVRLQNLRQVAENVFVVLPAFHFSLVRGGTSIP
jgi:hypothetical protein